MISTRFESRIRSLFQGLILTIILFVLMVGQLSAQSYQFTFDPSATEPQPWTWANDASLTGTTLIIDDAGVGSNNWQGPITLPFAFDFFGGAVSQVWVAENGLVTFANPSGSIPTVTNGALPSTNLPDSTIAAIWSCPETGTTSGNDGMYYGTYGTAPNRYFVIIWHSWTYGCLNDGNDFQYTRVILEEGTNNIYVVDAWTDQGNPIDDATVGVQLNSSTAVLATDTHDPDKTNASTPAGNDLTDQNMWTFTPFTLVADDGAVTDIETPFSGGCIPATGGEDSVRISFTSYSTTPLTNIPVFYSLDGGAPVAGTIPGPVATNTTVDYTFPTTITVPGGSNTYDLEAWSEVPGDPTVSNDSTAINFTTIEGIFSYPYTEDFESGPGGWEIATGTGVSNSSWEFGTPAKPSFNAAASGDSCFFNGGFTGQYNNNEDSWVERPCFDFSTLVDPVFEANIWIDTDNDAEGMILQSSVDNGATWQDVGSVNSVPGPYVQNWYNDESLFGVFWASQDGWDEDLYTSGTPQWINVKHELTGLGGEPNVRLRFAFGSSGITTQEGVGFDDVQIYDKPADDFTISKIVSPSSSGCGSGSIETTIEFTNAGTDSQTSADYQVEFLVDNVSISTESVATPATVNNGDTVTYTFAIPFNYSVGTTYDVCAVTLLTGDQLPENDTTCITFVPGNPIIDTYPYFEDFEDGSGGWEVGTGSANSTWVFGTPAKPTFNTAASGDSAWFNGGFTGEYNNNEESWVERQCFDFSSLGVPVFEAKVYIDSDNNADGMILQSSIDDGATWQDVGSVNSIPGPYVQNWYNDESLFGVFWASEDGWDEDINPGGTPQWIDVKHELTGLGGEPSVRLRFAFGSSGFGTQEGVGFDDVQIYDKPDIDLFAMQLLEPTSSCQLTSSEDVVLEIANNGALPQSNFTVGYQINSQPPVLETFNGTLNPGDIATYTFATTADFSAAGNYTLVGFTDVPDDTVFVNNDTTPDFFVDNLPFTSTYPYYEDFESGPQGWATLGSVFSFGTPNGGQTQTAASGVNAFTMTPGYNANDEGSVVSRCFDLTTVDNPGVSFDMSYDLGFNEGVVLQYSFDFGQNWTRLGNVGDGLNWYDDPNITSQPGGQDQGWEGSATGGWIPARIEAPVLANESNVIFRFAFAADATVTGNDEGFSFDNFSIIDIPAVDLGPDTALCEGDSIVYTLDPIFTDAFWSTGDTTTTITIKTPGGYVVSADAVGGFKSSDTVFVSFSSPNVDLGPSMSVCDDQTFTLSVPPTPGYTYQWSTGSTDTFAIASSPQTQYSLTVTDSFGCQESDDITLSFDGKPDIQLPANEQLCAGDVILLDATANVPAQTHDFLWNNGDQSGAIFVSSPGTYSVIATSDVGCTDTAEVTVQILPTPAVDLGPDKFECDGSVNFTLSAGNPTATSWQWSEITANGSSQLANQQFLTVTQPGNYAVVVENAAGCTSGDTITIGASSEPVVELLSNYEGCGSVTLDAGDNGNTYSWTTGESTQVVEVTESGTYGVVVEDQFGCSATASTDVLVTPNPDVSFFVPSQVFVDDDVQFIDNTVPVADDFNWDFGTGDVSTDQNPVYTYEAADTYLVTLTATKNNCTGSFTDTVIVQAFTDRAESAVFADLQAYPNPTDGLVRITGQLQERTQGELMVLDATGRLVLRQSFTAAPTLDTSIDLTQASAGVYFVILKAGGDQTQFKLVKTE